MSNQLEVTFEIILHATEDTHKIFEPIFELFQIKQDEFIIEKILGHYGNPILLAKTKLVKRRAEEFIKKMRSLVSKSQMDELKENIEMQCEDSTLFLRIGKNKLVNKEISLQQYDAIKIRVKMPI
jgi:RNA binding exosome subunit